MKKQEQLVSMKGRSAAAIMKHYLQEIAEVEAIRKKIRAEIKLQEAKHRKHAA
jgi:hypothetical protein